MRSNGGIEKYCSVRIKRRLLANDPPAWLVKHKRSRYIVTAILSSPLWMRAKQFAHLRKLCDELTRITGERYVLDHKIPIQHPYVCGLTVPWNIQVISHRCNVVKSNSWHPDQSSFNLEVIPEQLKLAV